MCVTPFQVSVPFGWSELSTAASYCLFSSRSFLSSLRRCKAVSVTGVSLSSDFIAGFCGETEEDHQQTVSDRKSVV